MRNLNISVSGLHAFHLRQMEYLEEDLPQISLEEAKYRQSLGLNEWEPLPEN